MSLNYFYDEFSQQIQVRADLVNVDYSQIEPRITEGASAGPWVIERPSFQGSVLSARFIERELERDPQRLVRMKYVFDLFKPRAWTMEFTLWN